MPSEFAPGGGNPRMTKAQMRKYLADMKKAQEAAKKKLIEEGKSEEQEKSSEISELEKKMDDVF